MVQNSEPGKKNFLKPKENTPKHGELFFDFEGEVSEPQITESGIPYKSKSISVVSSSYLTDDQTYFFGKRSAYFSGRRNQIHLSVSGNSLFGTHPDPFTISIPIRLGEQGAGSVILDRTVFVKGKKYGISLELNESKPTLYVNNLLQKSDGRTTSFLLESPVKLKRKTWEVISVYFDTLNHKYTLYQNGIETAEYENKQADTIGFGFPENDSTPLVLGKSFYGNLDGFHIHKGEPEIEYTKFEKVRYDDETKIGFMEGNTAISPVLETKYSNSSLTRVHWNIEQPKDTMLELYFRGSNQKFVDSNIQLPWTRIKSLDRDLPKNKFKYYQWKLWFRPDPMGKTVPNVISLSFEYTEQTPPDVPTRFRLESNPEQGKPLCFLWNSNHEKEVQNGGGYMIHYGLLPNRMLGSVFVKKDKNGNLAKIDGNEDESGFQNKRFCITEETLVNNIYIPEGELTSEDFRPLADQVDVSRKEKRGLLFQPGLTYYFRISSYNRYLNEWDSKDQRSPLSPAISFSFPKEVSN
ncbi:LamG domain-containing protein [Leptospira bandrabouensis]|uniref:LamG-like jellyroll fold domain-containing protein n=1 Tax=Leptospira bandrabouensis TaxID=2484903 RepID=UPI00223DB184|nr:LamG-like jellyroll fold domain-containing protein [Leptospira bandrabouensis]MCW7458647.1 LamG domain-containing protein [Leptospira bandrabouensis]MCW7478573.1 LamG domain-containing protein [Leptospira bandrabouensis]MCW7486142.1 LamG domain-containing protein [Leptospira bandrabouensis]